MFLAKVTVFCFAVLIAQCKSDCSVSITSLIDILPTDTFGNILYPYDTSNIVTTNEDSIYLACPGNQIVLKKNKQIQFNVEHTEFKCTNNEYISTNPQIKKYKIDELTCDALQPVERLVGYCGNINWYHVVIGFQFNNNFFIPQMQVCWDDVKKTALYASALIKYIPDGIRAQADKPPFRIGQLIGNPVYLPICYAKDFQKQNLWNSYGSIPSFLTPEIVGTSLLDRAHLVDESDFPYDAQQKLTFTYTNVAPQWGNFNKQNWAQVEEQIRSFVVEGKKDLKVYTGTSGIFQINNKDYYLYGPTSQIPVPKYFWKIVLKATGPTDKPTYFGVAILGLNDIFETTVTDPCENVMSSINWLNFPNANNVTSGYVIACDIDDFKNIPELEGVLPKLPTITGLLN